jgi:hypothetical protein
MRLSEQYLRLPLGAFKGAGQLAKEERRHAPIRQRLGVRIRMRCGRPLGYQMSSQIETPAATLPMMKLGAASPGR